MRYGIDEMLPPSSRAGARAGLSGVRDAARNDRQGDRDRVAARRHLCLLRRHAARPRLALRSVSRQGARRRRAHRLLAHGSAEDRARAIPDRKVVFFGIGFETTAPANAMAVWQARREGLKNFSHAGLARAGAARHPRCCSTSPANRVQGFIAPGHVCTVMGYREYEALAARFPRSDRGRRIRAGRSAGGHLDAGGATGRRPRRGGEPVRALGELAREICRRSR